MARGTMWAGSIAALGITGLVWLAWPAAPVIGGTPAASTTPSGEARTADDARPALTAHALRSARFIEVAVTACKRQPGAGVEVIAERGGHLYTARAGDNGLARVDVEDDGDVTVRARVGAFRTEPLAVDGPRASITACPGATVHGIVRDGDGTPETERIVQLVDAAGELVDEIETDEDGAYLLTDPMLDGATLVVASDGLDDEATRALRPLAPREDRELDLIVGDVRTVVGWVLDLDGEPQPGVVVTATAEAFGSRWVAFTDQAGAFAFEAVPAASLKVVADGGELGEASARVAESEATRREVSLTLEPTAHITIVAPELVGTVEIRCWDPRYHGADGLDGPAPDAFVSPYSPEDGIVWDEGAEEIHAIEGPEDDVVTSFPDPDEMMTAFEEALRGYDSADPEGSMVRMIQTMITEIPEMRTSFDQENGGLPEDPADQEAFLRELVAEEMEKNPEQFQMFASMAAEVQQGKSLMEAAQAAYGGWDEPVVDDDEGAMGEVAVVAEPAEPAVPDELAREPEDWQMVLNEDDDSVAYDFAVTDDNSPGFDIDDEVFAEVGDSEGFGGLSLWDGPGLPASTERRAQAATGALGDPIAVRASFHYEVIIHPTEGDPVYLGQVFVNPGDDLVIPYGDAGKMHLSGRVVDVDGQPVSGIEVYAAGLVGPATSDADGRFEATLDSVQATTWDVSLYDPAWRYQATTRRSITTVAGGSRDLGTIIMRTAEEEPPGQMQEPYGGIGGLVSLDQLGVRLLDVEEGCPLEMSGIEAGDTITTIDGVPAAELPMNELLVRLRGEAGTMVDLRVRTASGELYDVGVQRETVQPRTGWSGRHHDPILRHNDPVIQLDDVVID
ncbi:MAG: hypothetical protein EP329_04535 [Deltaproteobacteria bacterium]|nr:MAG: hypothetical protein EP329_04535 [Deltaproteobacteria bacterium]